MDILKIIENILKFMVLKIGNIFINPKTSSYLTNFFKIKRQPVFYNVELERAKKMLSEQVKQGVELS